MKSNAVWPIDSRSEMNVGLLKGLVGFLFLLLTTLVARADPPLLQVNDAGVWRLEKDEWQLAPGQAGSTVRGLGVPVQLNADIERCLSTRYCELPLGVTEALYSLLMANSSADNEPNPRFRAVWFANLILISRIGDGAEICLVVDRNGFGLGRLGVRIAIDQVSRRIYTYKCESTYRCHLTERGFDGGEVIGPMLDVKVSDLFFHEGRLLVVYALPSGPGDRGLLGKLGHGRFMEDWWVAELTALKRFENARIVARRQVNSAGNFVNKFDMGERPR